MKVFVVCVGEYSDEYPEAVYLNEDDAQTAVDTIKPHHYSRYFEFEVRTGMPCIWYTVTWSEELGGRSSSRNPHFRSSVSWEGPVEEGEERHDYQGRSIWEVTGNNLGAAIKRARELGKELQQEFTQRTSQSG